MIFKCEVCKYNTSNKSNYNKHLQCKLHMDNCETAKKFRNKRIDATHRCNGCNKIYRHQSGLCRHKRYCEEPDKNQKSADIIEELTTIKTMMVDCQNKMVDYQKQNDALRDQLMEYAKNNPSVSNTYNISIKNCLQRDYADAPALEGLPDYFTLTYEDDEYPYEEYRFIDTLIYNYENSCLIKYLGDFVIQNYKKDDPAQQSMWSSDISRLTYIIKELLATNNSIWNHDYKGVKTKIYIIDPLLKYIKEYMDEYWIITLDKYTSNKIENINKYHKMYVVLHKIKKDIETGVLGNAIIRYIAPSFYMSRNITNEIDNMEKIEDINRNVTNEIDIKACFVD